MKATVPTKYRVLASLVPILALMTAWSTYRTWTAKQNAGRLAAEKRGRMTALPHLEQGRELVERARDYLRLPGDPELRRQEIRDFAELAVEHATRALETAPDSEEALRIRGRALELQYNFDEALGDLQEASRQHPAAPSLYDLGLLGTRMLARARLDGLKTSLLPPEALVERASEPLRRFQGASGQHGVELDVKYARVATVCVAYAVGDWNVVPVAARAAREWDATEWRVPYIEGLAYCEAGRLDEALRSLDEAARLAPAIADIPAWQGAVLRKLGRRPEAIAALSRALEMSEHFLEAYSLRGTLLFEDGRFADARADFAACARLRPSLADVQQKLGVAALEHWERSGRSEAASLDEAVQALTAAVEARPREPQLRLLRARAFLGRGAPDKADADVAEALALSPDWIEARLLRAEIREAAGRFADAEQDYAAVLEKADPARQAGVLRRRARARARAGRVDEAIADLDALLAKDPRDAGLHLEKVQLLAQAGRADAAFAALEAAPTTAPLLRLRAELLLARGDAAGARATAERALQADPELAEAYVVRGRAALAAGDKAAAAEDFRRALEKRPSLKDVVGPLLAETRP
ncbi:MAG TPA: tetratricopeptide repeat protein [Planctomycetota bacterium]|nr:tetratricopeptide repeat protein [Planctomycetota bacterium]